jgi:hypothetical protein
MSTSECAPRCFWKLAKVCLHVWKRSKISHFLNRFVANIILYRAFKEVKASYNTLQNFKKCFAKLHSKIRLQNCIAKLHCKIALQNCIAKLDCKIRLKNCIEKLHGKLGYMVPSSFMFADVTSPINFFLVEWDFYSRYFLFQCKMPTSHFTQDLVHSILLASRFQKAVCHSCSSKIDNVMLKMLLKVNKIVTPSNWWCAATFSITTFSIMTISIMTFSITTLSITTLSNRDNQHNDTQHNDTRYWVSLCWMLLCSVSPITSWCWVSLCLVSLCWMSWRHRWTECHYMKCGT